MSLSAIDVRHQRVAAIIAVGIGVVMMPMAALAQQGTAISAEASDPGKLGWMVGSPPPEDKIIRFSDSDYFSFPKLRWTVCHFRQLMPTVGVSRGIGAPVPFERKIDTSIDAVKFTPLGSGKEMTWAESLAANYTDGIVSFTMASSSTNATRVVLTMPASTARCR